MIFLLVVSMLCIANDNGQPTPQQKFLILTDNSRIAVDNTRIKLFSKWQDYLEDNPKATDISVSFDLKIYEQLSTVIQTNGSSFPAKRDTIQQLYWQAHDNGLKQEYLKSIRDHAIYNYKEFELASNIVQQALANDLINDDNKIAQLLCNEFRNKQLPKKTFNFTFITSAHYLGYKESRGFLSDKKPLFWIFPLKEIMVLKQPQLTITDLKANCKAIAIISKSDASFRIFEAGCKLLVIEGNVLHLVDLLDSNVESMEFQHGSTKIDGLVYDKKRQKAYVCYNYGYHTSEFDKKIHNSQIREWDLANFSSDAIKDAPVIFDRILNNPIQVMHFDKYFNELQWGYKVVIDGRESFMWCTYKLGHDSQMQTTDRIDFSGIGFVGNRIMLSWNDKGDICLNDMLSCGRKKYNVSGSTCTFSSHGLFNIQYRSDDIYYLCYQNVLINNLQNSRCSIGFVSNRFLIENQNTLIDLKEINDAYKKLSGGKLYIQRIPKEEKVDIA